MALRNRIISAGLVASLLMGSGLVAIPTSVAYADPQDDLEVAKQTLETLGEELASIQEQLESATESLEQTQYSIGQKESEIGQTQADLDEKSELLGSTMKSSYKVGSSTLLDYVLGSTSVEDFISRVYYLDKVSNQQAEAIEEVRTLQTTLQSQKDELVAAEADQQTQVDSLNTQVSDYESRVSEARDYYDQLDAEVQAQLAEQAAEEERVRLALEAAEQQRQAEALAAQEQTNAATNTADSNNTSNNSNESGNTSSEPTETPSSNENSGSSSNSNSSNSNSSSSSSSSSSSVGGGVSTAYAQIGKSYSWGATGPNSFDCSGLVCYCYGYARGRSTYAMISSIQSSGGWKTSIDQLEYGDLVFTSSGGHVGIYVGNGRMVHAANYSVGVIEGEIYNFYGGGSYY